MLIELSTSYGAHIATERDDEDENDYEFVTISSVPLSELEETEWYLCAMLNRIREGQ